jgi:ubiquinone biosynthesis protein UbiJ
MIKNFFKRIISEVIKELISPQLEEFRKFILLQQESFQGEIRTRLEGFEKNIEARFDDFKSFMVREVEDIKQDIRAINRRLDDLYQVVVRREEHYSLVDEVRRLRDDVEMLKRKVFQQQ